ncbi:alpha/beta fold hydrolase [Dokdonella immobilis]|uniref:Putative phosphoribosyl transferase n=1 Tax=Dokdonella immobilis TaxID=578942 RepID=A0A1I4ZB40_9GAMM|nr:alpha/beta fold hydrolase [Dokdonella immobilis]SFN47512.1 putative phosphoribosyl transferase [Dokdonella immobilis]
MDALLPFRDRAEAGRHLAAALARFRGSRPLVLAIPRGAVPMARLIADALDGDLDVILVRKLGAPDNPEFAIGAIDESGETMLDDNAVRWSGADRDYLRREAGRQLALIRERRSLYCGNRPGIDPTDRTVIVVDDGLATGATMLSALHALRGRHPRHLVCAVPVAARDSLVQVGRVADEVVVLASPPHFGAVGRYYRDFGSVSDEAVIAALSPGAQGTNHPEPASDQAVHLHVDGQILEGDLASPPDPKGLVIFAHGSGSSRRSIRNRFVAQALRRRGFATLLFDLLTPHEDRDTAMRFDITLLADRLRAALDWARQDPAWREQPIALFGASTGAAAALRLAAQRPSEVVAVISRGGRPDLAGPQALARVRSPVLLLVGSADTEVLALNRDAQARLGGRAEVVVVPGATHLFEEPGTLEQVASLSANWLAQRVPEAEPSAPGV